jgi:hypothetical protein
MVLQSVCQLRCFFFKCLIKDDLMWSVAAAGKTGLSKMLSIKIQIYFLLNQPFSNLDAVCYRSRAK